MSQAVYYKVSYVVEGGKHPGALMNVDEMPGVGDEVTFDGFLFVITEVTELMPPMGDFGFLHASCRLVKKMNPNGQV